MGLISTEVEVVLCSPNIKRYEELGYNIPRYKNKYGTYTVKQGTKIRVQVEDLSDGSNESVMVSCDCCNKQYELPYYRYKKQLHDGLIYCSSCAAKNLISGEKHYLWDATKTPEERILKRGTVEGYTDFLKIVLKRDKYTCQCCGASGVQLNVHHLNGYDWCVEGRIDTNNGITLCEQCHKNFHSIYGKGLNTKEQFEEWIGYTINLTDTDFDILPTSRMVYCFENDKIYNGVKEFCKEFDVKDATYVYSICNKKIMRNYANPNLTVIPKTIHGVHVVWYDDYLKMSKEDVENYIDNNQRSNKKKVVCTTDNNVFDTISKAAIFYKIDNMVITNCCNGVKESHKRRDGTILQFMYYADFIKNQKENKL